MQLKTYLALGDSYTIGEQVPLTESFPYQTIQLLRKADVEHENNRHVFAAPEIIAKTGWTTDELLAAIGQHIFLSNYDIVSLLIGVNNQYRGRTAEEFKTEFEILLQTAVQLAGGISSNVYVLSIPDWGITPFNKDRDANIIAKEIDAFNKVCADKAAALGTNYIDITDDQRIDGKNAEFLAADGLHPSGKEYQKWASKLSQRISEGLK